MAGATATVVDVMEAMAVVAEVKGVKLSSCVFCAGGSKLIITVGFAHVEAGAVEATVL